LNSLQEARHGRATLECPLCCSVLDDSSLKFLQFHLRNVHPGANVYDVKFVSLVNLLKEYQRREKAYRAIRDLR
jgi:hypothetical protein